MGKFVSFLLGGLVGATAALLFAPRSGEETRALVAEKADEYWGKGQTWYDQGKVYVKEGIAGVQPAISKRSDELRQKIDNARVLIAEQVAKNASAARDVISDKVPVAAERINQAADVVHGHIDSAAGKIKPKTAETAVANEVTVASDGAFSVEGAAQADDGATMAAPDKLEPATSEGA